MKDEIDEYAQIIRNLLVKTALEIGKNSSQFEYDAKQDLMDAAAKIGNIEGVHKIKAEGQTDFLFVVQTPVGNAVIYYQPQAAAEMIYKKYDEEITKHLDDIGLEDGGEEALRSDFHRYWMYQQSSETIETLSRQMYVEFEDAVINLPKIAISLQECIWKERARHFGQSESEGATRKIIKNKIEVLNNKRLDRWKEELQDIKKDEGKYLLRRYDELHLVCKKIKKYHNSQRKLYKENYLRKGYNQKKWETIWIDIAKHFYNNQPEDFLILFASLDGYINTPSKIAYSRLATETNYSKVYLEKLISKERSVQKQRMKKPDIKQI